MCCTGTVLVLCVLYWYSAGLICVVLVQCWYVCCTGTGLVLYVLYWYSAGLICVVLVQCWSNVCCSVSWSLSYQHCSYPGAVLNAAKRIQLNLNLKRSTMFTELKRVRDVTMLPIYYGEQTGKVTPDLANDFKEQVYAIKYGISAGVWALVGVAGMAI